MTDIIEGQAVDVTSSAVTVAQPQQGGMPAVTVEKLRVLNNALGGDLGLPELTLFAEVANRSGLDPFAKQIFAIRRKGKVTFQTGIDGYRSIAARTGEYDGQDEPVYGPMVTDDRRWPWPHPEWATVRVYRKGMSRGVAATAFWEEYAPSDERDQFMWRRMPRVMIAKVAEALGLRKAFPYVYGGLYTDDEMAQAGDTDRPTTERAAQTAAAPAATPSRPSTPPKESPAHPAPVAPPSGRVTFEGPVVATPDGTRSTASGKVLGFAIKVGNSKHNIDLWDDLAVAALPHIKEGVRIRVDGHVVEEDWPGRGNRPMKKVIKDVTRVWLADGDLIAEAKPKAPQPVQQPLMADDGPPLFDDDVLGSAPPPPPAPEPVVQTRDPAEPADATVDLEGTIRSVSWQQTPNGATVAYIELVVGNGLFKVAMKQDDAIATIAQGDAFVVASGDRLRVMGGWNPKGTMILAGIAIPL